MFIKAFYKFQKSGIGDKDNGFNEEGFENEEDRSFMYYYNFFDLYAGFVCMYYF